MKCSGWESVASYKFRENSIQRKNNQVKKIAQEVFPSIKNTGRTYLSSIYNTSVHFEQTMLDWSRVIYPYTVFSCKLCYQTFNFFITSKLFYTHKFSIFPSHRSNFKLTFNFSITSGIFCPSFSSVSLLAASLLYPFSHCRAAAPESTTRPCLLSCRAAQLLDARSCACAAARPTPTAALPSLLVGLPSRCHYHASASPTGRHESASAMRLHHPLTHTTMPAPVPNRLFGTWLSDNESKEQI